MLSGTLGASLLGNTLAGKGIHRTRKGKGIDRAGEGIVRASYGFLIPSHPLTNFEIQKYYKNKPRFNKNFIKNKGWVIYNKY